MNERITELALQAGFSKDKYSLYWDEDANADGVDLEKFAELIVRECAEFLCKNSGYDECDNAWFPEPEDLLQHFGVKE